jgi:hypothetical protein
VNGSISDGDHEADYNGLESLERDASELERLSQQQQLQLMCPQMFEIYPSR